MANKNLDLKIFFKYAKNSDQIQIQMFDFIDDQIPIQT